MQPRIWFILTLIFVTKLLAGGRAAAEDFTLNWEYATGKDLPLAVIPDRRDRSYLYIALKRGGLEILDTSGPTPKRVSKLSRDRFRQMDVMNLFQQGDRLYLALGDHFSARRSKHAGMAVVDVGDPRRPRVSSVWQTPQPKQGGAVVVADRKFAYLGGMSTGVMIIDLSRPTLPRHRTTIQPDVHFPRDRPTRIGHPNSRGLAVQGKHLFVANDAGGLRVIDVSKSEQPREIGRYINPKMANKQQAYNNIVLDGDLAYIAIDYAGLEIVDISDPTQIHQVGWWNPWAAEKWSNQWLNSPGHTNQLHLDRLRNEIYLSAGDSELQVIDVSDPEQPRLIGAYGEPKNGLGVWGVGVSADEVYLAYIKTVVPFRGSWSGIKALRRN